MRFLSRRLLLHEPPVAFLRPLGKGEAEAAGADLHLLREDWELEAHVESTRHLWQAEFLLYCADGLPLTWQEDVAVGCRCDILFSLCKKKMTGRMNL